MAGRRPFGRNFRETGRASLLTDFGDHNFSGWGRERGVVRLSNPSRRRCSAQDRGRRVRFRRSAATSTGWRPWRMASTMSGARKASGKHRLTSPWSTPWRVTKSPTEDATPVRSSSDLLRGLAGVDRAAQAFHRASSDSSPNNRGPDQRAPVMARAAAPAGFFAMVMRPRMLGMPWILFRGASWFLMRQ